MRSIRGNEIALIPQEPMAAFSPVHTIGNQLIENILLHQEVKESEAFEIAIERLKEVGIPNPEESMNRYSWDSLGRIQPLAPRMCLLFPGWQRAQKYQLRQRLGVE